MKDTSYTHPVINETLYQSNNSIVTNNALENSVIKLSRVFLDSLFTGQVLPDEIIDQLIDDPENIDEIIISADADQWLEWTKGSRHFFIALVIGLIFTALMSIIGIFWCIGRCCCGCGKGRKKAAGDACTQSWFLWHS